MTQEPDMPPATAPALPAVPDHLPPGWSAQPHTMHPPLAETFPEPAPPVRPAPGPAMSGVLTTVTSRGGSPVTVHRADYAVEDHLGEYTVHGYAWRCTGCGHLATGYEPTAFANVLGNGRDHECGEPS
ncbi:hypothetical protein [Streptomyces iconiensis]|uniref:Uncharacterized protein n=1 Tax=Streptomyces iconiensis TaxID=1384038 RepID=A0ABT6ZQZ3_9ACTN|nr:hypothetical protein [Streptomyces iconiensis]MDJ1131214.1 hypothetical protein [Streptomyces iconiensis]